MTTDPTAPLCFIDTETTGVHRRRQPWEIAMIRREPDGVETEASFMVKVDLHDADVFGLAVGRFYERHPDGQWLSGRRALDPEEEPVTVGAGPEMLTREDAASTVARVTHGAHLVGLVPSFDAETFADLLYAHFLIPGWHYHLVDAETLAVGYLQAREQDNVRRLRETQPDIRLQPSRLQPPWTSEYISERLLVEPPSPEDRHTALGDARWAMRLYDAVMDQS